MTHPVDRSPLMVQLGIACLVIATLLNRMSYTVADPDLWGHVRFGQDALATGQIIHSDPYSYLSGTQEWVNHEWIFEWAVGAAFNRFAAPGLVAMKVLLLMCMLWIMYGDLRRQGGAAVRAGIILLCVGFLMLGGTATIRPQLFTYACFLLMLLIIRSADRGPALRIWLAPLLVIIWVNMHGGVLAGVAILGIWITVRLTTSVWTSRNASALWATDNLNYSAAGIASLLALLVNPYGDRLPLFLLKTATVPRPEISEWAPLSVLSYMGLSYLAILLVSLYAFSRSRRPRSMALLVVFVASAMLPLQAIRHLPLFALAVAALMGEHLLDLWDQLSPAEAGANASTRMDRIMGIGTLAGALVLGLASVPNFKKIYISPAGFTYPVRAVALLKASQIKGNLAVYFDWGEYVLWHLGPGIKVSIDGRRETVYSDEVRAENLRWTRGVGRWDSLLDDQPTDIVLVGNTLPTFNLMKLKAGWTMAYEDSFCAIFVREGSPHLETIRQTPVPELPANGGGTSFP